METTYNFTIEQLREAYIRFLRDAAYFWKGEKSEAEVADKMFQAIYNSNYPSDWLAHNSALRKACKKFGITKSGELREFIKEKLTIK